MTPDEKLVTEMARTIQDCCTDYESDFPVSSVDAKVAAQAILALLTTRKRLVPDDAGETVNSCGCPVRYTVARIEEHTRKCEIEHEEWTIREFGGD